MTRYGIIGFVIGITIYALCYLVLIQSVFLPKNLNNPIIATVVTDKEAIKYSEQAFMTLRNFNDGISNIEPEGDIFAFLPVNPAAMLNFHYKLSEHYEVDNKVTPAKRIKKFKYEPTFELRLNRGVLILFLFSEIIMICVLIGVIYFSKNKYTNNFEEEILRSYHAVMFSFLSSAEDSENNTELNIKK